MRFQLRPVNEVHASKPYFGRKLLCCILALALVSVIGVTSVTAQNIEVETDPIECLPLEENGVGYATVDNNIPDTTVRMYFRRMHEAVEDLYWVEMQPEGDGRYSGVLPKAEDQELQRYELEERRQELQESNAWAQWWREKDTSVDRNPNDDLSQELIRERASQGKEIERDWLTAMDNSTFQDWLEQLENEPAEYYASVHDHTGAQLAKSRTRVAEVRENCRVELTPEQLGLAENMTVGETAYWQRDEGIFHWLCEGVISRIDPTNIPRGDGICRACVVAWYKRPEILIPATVGAATLGGIILIEGDDPPPVSPSNP